MPQGDPPDNAQFFLPRLQERQPNVRLHGVNFTLLGLGDSVYTTYQKYPNFVKSRCVLCV